MCAHVCVLLIYQQIIRIGKQGKTANRLHLGSGNSLYSFLSALFAINLQDCK